MSRILKRPMFRRGGKVNEGIMSGLVDRKNYANGPEDPFAGSNIDREALIGNRELLESILEQSTPKTRLPIGEVGLNLASGMSFTDALRDPYKRFTRADDAREAAIKGGAAKLAIGQALKSDKVGTLKQARNTSNQTLFGVKPGETGFFTAKQLVAGQGLIQPIDTRMGFELKPDGTFVQRPVSEIEREADNKIKAKSLGTQYNILGDLIGDMKTRLPDTPSGVVGTGFAVIEGFSDQTAQLAESLGIKEGLVIKDQSVIDNYLKEKGFTEKAQSAATMKASVINLGYALAKIAEPDNPRLSEGDIIRQLNRINFGASRNVFSASLDQIFKEEGIRAKREIENLGFDFDEILNPGKKTSSAQNGDKSDSGSKDDFNPLGFPEDKLSPLGP
jgi:hypothetical protein